MSAPAKVVDLAILNATVVDGTGAPAAVTDVTADRGRIDRVGPFRGRARKTVDAYGRVLIPGFVDLHGHSDYSLLVDPLARSKVCQGVTTEVGGNCGYHAAPVFGQIAADRRDEYARTVGLEVSWATSAEYRARLREARPAINYAQQIGYNTLRSAVTAEHARPLSGAERQRLRDLVRGELSEGAVGLSYGLAYAPACFSRTEELVDVAEEVAARGAFISFHLRNEDATLIESLEEAVHIGRASGAATHVGHLKTFRRPNWHKIDRALSILDQARRGGLDLTVDRYPHLAMNTQLKFILPTWALEGGVQATRQRLGDPRVRARIAAELADTVAGEVREVLISLVGLPEHKAFEGQFLDELARGRDVWAMVMDLLALEGDAAFATFFGMSRENLDRILQLDYAVVASDASVQPVHRQAGGGRPHPRCFDTFPFFLADWVYARRVLSLEEAVRKVTSMPAARAGLKDRGRIQEGLAADLVLLDPEALEARVSYEEPLRYPPGVDLVVVNGEVAVVGGRHTGARAGRLLGPAGELTA